MLNNFAPPALKKRRITITLVDGSIITKEVDQHDYEIKFMNEEVVGYKYVVLLYASDSGYGYNERYEASHYNMENI